ncbi:autotransporter outer membrane beta-barrel domain-containing protein [Helicobacter apodemus]|uniref:Autotransporter domain-containing protein n=1 Tax=Helicobacter apodemus TaxID=135569 RepID=A0A2U8FB24_9HELI|nr:autotransporter outer membrane beta-barrel domain-containing protein [Helicobacter apodemus]AWI33356.1 hypothetical protein CDV25_00250 [Helicobacter apodemus]
MQNSMLTLTTLIPSGGGGKIMPHSTPIETIKVNVKDYVLNLDFKSNVKTLDSKSNPKPLDSQSNPKPLDSQSLNMNFDYKYSKLLNPKVLDSNLNTKAMNPKPLDSQSLISQLFNPKFLDSNSNLKPLYSRINVKTLDSNPKIRDINFKLLNPKSLSPSFLSLICASVLLTIPHSISAKDNWVAIGNDTLDTTTDTNANKVTKALTNKQISASQTKEYKNLEITNTGSITNTNANYAINIQNNATIESITNKGLISGSGNHNISINTSSIQSFENIGTITNTNTGKFNFNITQGTIDNFSNSGIIDSKGYGIALQPNTTITNFNNTGTILAKETSGRDAVFINKATIQTFSNEGLIKSEGNRGVGINILNGTSITNFENKGTITASNNTGIYVRGGIIKTLINEGSIISAGANSTFYSGISLEGGGTIENIINIGTIRSNGFGIDVAFNGKFGNLIMKDGAVVHGNLSGIAVGVNQTLGELEISGANTKISGGENGISLQPGSKAQKITIKDGAKIEGGYSGINLWNNADLSGDMNISGVGSMIKGGSDAGIFNENSNITGNITISDGATITATSGKAIWNNGNATLSGGITISGANTKLEGDIVNADNAKIGSEIKIEKGASVNGGLVNNGNASISGNITIDESSKLNSITNTSSNANAITGSIETKSSTPLAISNSGSIGGDIKTAGNAELKINNSGSGSIGGSITASGNAPISITNSDNAKVAGNIEVSGDAPIVIKNEGNATLQSDIINSGSGNLSLSNTGNASIGANIKNNGSGSLSISNTGKVSDTTKIESNGSGKVEVEEWLVSTNSQGEVKPLEITGTNLSVVSVSNVTFDAGNITNLSSLVQDPKNVINIDTSQDTNISNPAEINSKVFAKAEFKTNDPSVNVNVDALSKTLSFSVDAAKTSAAALGKTLISNTQARANFVNAVMGNAMNAVNLIHNQGSANVYSNFNKAYEEGAIYANFDNLGSDALLRSSETKDKNHLAFMLPYISKSNTSLNGGLTSKGHTKGVIFGYSYLNPNNKDIYGIYGGYDDFSSKTYPSDILALNNRTYYAGVRYYHPFNYKDYELFSKFSSQFGLIQNDISERVGQTEFKGEPKSYAYDANVNMGINIKLNTKHTLTPEIGLGYNGGYSKAYTMSNAINTITRRNYTHKMNLFKTKTSLSFYSDWHKHFKTLVYAGVDWTMNPNVDNPKGRYSNIGYYGGGESKLDNLEYALGTTLVIPLNDAFYFSLNYGMNGTKNTTMHTGYGKFNYMW